MGGEGGWDFEQQMGMPGFTPGFRLSSLERQQIQLFLTDVVLDRLLDIHRQMDRPTDRWTDGLRVNGHTDKQTDRETNSCIWYNNM